MRFKQNIRKQVKTLNTELQLQKHKIRSCMDKMIPDKLLTNVTYAEWHPLLMSPWHREKPCTWTGILLIRWQMSLGQMSHKQIATWTKGQLNNIVLNSIPLCQKSFQHYGIWTIVFQTSSRKFNRPISDPNFRDF